MRSVTASAVVVFLFVPALAQQDFSDVQIKTTHMAGNVYMLAGSGGNIGLSVGEDGVLMIDDQYAPLEPKIREAIRKLGKGKPKFIINTHWHGDHVGGNERFGRDGTIIAHANVRKRVSAPQELFGDAVKPLSKNGLPVITYDQSMSVYFNGEEIRLLHFPAGHTDGDTVVLFTRSKVVHVADLMFAGRFPFIDLEHGGTVEGYVRNVAAVIKLVPPDFKVIPGHGPPSTLADLNGFHKMLTGTTEYIKMRIKQGRSKDWIQQHGLTDRWRRWGEGFISQDQWIDTVYTGLTTSR